MRYVNMLDTWLDQFDMTSLFQMAVITLVLLKMYALQICEKLDVIVERVPSKYGWFRRAATILESVAWLWLVLYQYEEHLAPRPPGVFLALACLANAAARLAINHKDYCRSTRLGREVATIADALPIIRHSGRGALPPSAS